MGSPFIVDSKTVLAIHSQEHNPLHPMPQEDEVHTLGIAPRAGTPLSCAASKQVGWDSRLQS